MNRHKRPTGPELLTELNTCVDAPSFAMQLLVPPLGELTATCWRWQGGRSTDKLILTLSIPATTSHAQSLKNNLGMQVTQAYCPYLEKPTEGVVLFLLCHAAAPSLTEGWAIAWTFN